MTELETIERAKMYLDKMANGIDPLSDKSVPETDMINQVRISRCLFFVSDVLRRVLENGGIETKQRQKQPPKRPLEITAEQLSRFEPDPQGLTLSNLAKRINALIDNEDMVPLKYTAITEWLQEMGMLKTVVNANGNNTNRPTESGNAAGIFAVDKDGPNGPYVAVVYNAAAQQFIVDNIDALIGIQNSKNNHEMRDQPWSAAHDDCLVDLYRKGVPVSEIAATLKRTNRAILARIKKLGLE